MLVYHAVVSPQAGADSGSDEGVERHASPRDDGTQADRAIEVE